MSTTKVAHAFSNLVREIRKKHVGKGPEQITTRFVGPWAVCEMKGNLTSVEKFAVGSEDGRRLVRELRTTFIKQIYQDAALRADVEKVVGAKLITLFCDFDVDLDIAMTVYVFDRPLGLDDENAI
ncbi:DUF2294 domain-containing protein [Alicyclobacillus fastidiosus]|uniref:DUF2294 domain-containing protein n=1 Tax=Alicyclobacillus fastidiosus TaxID=392011 RepID=A0ABY6ZGB1_9BACL|nr:DUF2294 domain-containing protein [Alicyclobacillus fastidiosus]WAH41159.1 DUF2294 domain-containing protein [Alicyclobacillus fastidiosus]GMA62730.1 hypothetical protein GCM10025859_31700 [Alicyclobacillus fastidiosus]